MSEDQHPAPGWYPDVEVPGGERYWDGRAWTDHRRPGATAWDTAAAGGSSPWGDGTAAAGTSTPAWGGGTAAWSTPAQTVDTWLWQSIVATILCCQPLGIAGIVFAAQAGSARDAGNLAVAQQRAAQARTWTLWAFGVGFAFYFVIFGFGVLGLFAV